MTLRISLNLVSAFSTSLVPLEILLEVIRDWFHWHSKLTSSKRPGRKVEIGRMERTMCPHYICMVPRC